MELALRGLGLSDVRTIPNPVDLHRFLPSARDEALLRELAIPDEPLIPDRRLDDHRARRESLPGDDLKLSISRCAGGLRFRS